MPLVLSAGGPGFNPQSRTDYTKDVIKMVQYFPCLAFIIKNGNTGSFSRIKIEILRSRRSLAVVAGMKQRNDHAEPIQSNAKINKYAFGKMS